MQTWVTSLLLFFKIPTVYRIKHLPSGFYFCPSREIQVKLANDTRPSRYVKSNLSKPGKTYLKKPSLSYLGGGVYSHLIQHINQLDRYGNHVIKVNPDEWEIEEIV